MPTMNVERQFGQYFLGDILEWIADNLEPEEVFTTQQLELWAENNDFVLEE